MAQYCKEYLHSQGYQVSYDDCGKILGAENGNLIAILPGDPNLEAVLLSAHMDTVGGGLAPDQVSVQHGVWSGDGNTPLGADDKAGIAIILAAASRMAQDYPFRPTIQVVFTIAEELGMRGVQCLSHKQLQLGWGLALDLSLI
ncbi:M20/M25/M40 family metallo-hydrolase, partial [Alicyclobacillaceae bacterium I2511]